MSQVASGSAARVLLSDGRDPGRLERDWIPVLAEVPLFQGLSKRHLKRVAALGRKRRFAAGTAIVRKGDHGTAFYVLLDGTVRVVPPKGRSRQLRAGDSFGEMALLEDAPRSADVLAEVDVLTMTISPSAFAKLLRKEPALTQALLRTLAARLRAAETPA